MFVGLPMKETLHSTPVGQTHWSTRTMAKEVGLSHERSIGSGSTMGVRRIANRAPKRFVWTKDADMILAKVQRCKDALLTGH